MVSKFALVLCTLSIMGCAAWNRQWEKPHPCEAPCNTHARNQDVSITVTGYAYDSVDNTCTCAGTGPYGGAVLFVVPR